MKNMRARFSQWPAPMVCVVFVAILGTNDHARADMAFDGQVLNYESRTVYDLSPDPMYPEVQPYTAWTGAWKLPNGTLQINFVQATGPQNNPTITYPVLQSADNGHTWSRVPGDVPTGYSRGMAVLPDGMTMVRPDATGLYFDANGILQYPNNNFMGIRRSTTGGTSWNQPINLVSPVDYQISLPTVIKPLRDGRLVAMAGITPATLPAETAKQNMVKTMFVSSDQGQTWGSPIILMPVSDGVSEESDFVELANGDLLWEHRAIQYAADGTYLGQPRRQSIVNQVGGVFVPQPPQAPYSYADDGFPSLLMSSQGVILDFSGLGSRWSADQGQTWHDLYVGSQPLRTAYYPRAVEADDGTIVVASHVGQDDGYGTVDQSIVVQTFRLPAIIVPEPAAIFEHVGDADPVTEGYTDGLSGSSAALADAGPPANWRMLSPSGSAGTYGFASTPEFEATLIDPIGWTFSMTVKLNEGDSVYESSIRIRDASNRLEMHLIDGSGGLPAGVYYTNPAGTIDVGSLISSIDPTSGFHTYQMIKNPNGAGTVDDEISFYVNGGHALTLLQSSMYGAGGAAQHFFGTATGAGGDTVDQQYSLVRFETGMNVVSNVLQKVSFTLVAMEDTVAMEFVSQSNVVYRLDSTTDLVTPDSFVSTGAYTLGSGTNQFLFDPSGFSTSKAYRIVVNPM